MYEYTQFDRDGLTITVTYDHDASSPLDWGVKGLAISPYDRNSKDYGDTDLLSALVDNDDDRDTYTMELDQAIEDWRENLDAYTSAILWGVDERNHRVHFHHSLNSLRDAVDSLQDVDNDRAELVTFDWCPYVDLFRYFHVVYDPREFCQSIGLPIDTPADDIRAMVENYVSSFNVWYRGGVFVITVEKDEELLDSLGDVMFNDDYPLDDEIWVFVQSNMVTE